MDSCDECKIFLDDEKQVGTIAELKENKERFANLSSRWVKVDSGVIRFYIKQIYNIS